MEDNAKLREAYSILNDLTAKASKDVRNALDTPLELAKEVAGITGMYGLGQKIGAQMMVGAGMMFAAMRDGKPSTNTNDDLLWVCLMAYEAERDGATEKGFENRVQKMFMNITGHEHRVPDWWKRN